MRILSAAGALEDGVQPVLGVVPMKLGSAHLADEPAALVHEHAVGADEAQEPGHGRTAPVRGGRPPATRSPASPRSAA